ncbi:MAG: hypothetical protein JNM14_08230, partial [Ferruginibacter sp.]|nr:hypothetical protein [Ferruginibacter sp.]
MFVNTKIFINTALLFSGILFSSCGDDKKKEEPVKPEKGRIKTEVKK